jgi:hypothetical protein
MRGVVLAAAALLATSCKPYDPDLGPKPFQCGTDEPRCPDGYTPVDVSKVRCECWREPPQVDAGPAYPCNGDSHEQNDSIATATPTHVGPNAADTFSTVAICPASDIDIYDISVPLANNLIVLSVVFDESRSPPDLDLLDAGGVSLHPTVTSPQSGQLSATYQASATGHYYVRLSGREEVNYYLRIMLVPPA